MTQELYRLLCPLLVKSFSRDLHTGEELFAESLTDKTVKFHITDLFFRFKLCTDRILQFYKHRSGRAVDGQLPESYRIACKGIPAYTSIPGFPFLSQCIIIKALAIVHKHIFLTGKTCKAAGLLIIPYLKCTKLRRCDTKAPGILYDILDSQKFQDSP